MSDSRDELIQLLKDTIEFLKQQNAEQARQNQELTQTIANLTETIESLKHKIYGTSREKMKHDIPGQLDLFNEAEAEQDSELPEPAIEAVISGYVRNSKKPKSKRKDLLEGLPIEKVICYVSDEERICEICGTEMETIGTKYVREELQIIPAQVKRLHYYQEVVGCPQCKKEDSVIYEAPTPTPLFKHTFASPSTVAYVMYQKYVNAMPLYRQEQDWKQMGVILSRATMANWVIHAGLDYLKPIYERLHEHLLQRDIIHADETPCQVLKEEGREATTKSYMWIYLSGDDSLPGIVLYDYQPGRKGIYAQNFLEGYHGFIHCDGYTGYNKLEDVIRVGCLSHCRRYFFDAIPKNKSESASVVPAEVGFEYCNRLFELEKLYKELDADTKKQKRLDHERPVLEAFWKWLDTVNPVGGSCLAKAVNYAQNQKEYLMNYLLDGRCAISNNAALSEGFTCPHLLPEPCMDRASFMKRCG